MELSLNELRLKQVINIFDGKCLGHICDAIFDECYGKLLGFVVPGNRRFCGFFKPCNDLFVPFQNICKIGIDVILVELLPNTQRCDCNQAKPISSFNQNNFIKATNYELSKEETKNNLEKKE